MISEGVILETKDNKAKVRVVRKSSCGENCASCNGCAENSLHITVNNDINARKGDKVQLESKTSSVLISAFILYILPLLIFVTVYLMFEKIGEGTAALLSVIMFLITFINIKVFYKKIPEVKLIRILSSEEEND